MKMSVPSLYPLIVGASVSPEVSPDRGEKKKHSFRAIGIATDVPIMFPNDFFV